MIAARDRSSPARIAAGLIASVCAFALAPAVAQQTATPPAPPAASAPPPAAPAQPRALAPLPPLDTSVPPPLLPRASRERMRACADEWNVMKRKSIAGLPTWREFATGCLTRAAPPPAQKPRGTASP
jgi:hypothetical protein